MRETWKPISWTSWTASRRVATKRRQCAGRTFRKRMARVGRSVSRPLRTRWRSERSSWCWRLCLSKTSYPSFGFRPGRSAHQALQYLRAGFMSQRLRWVIDIDIKKYFDSIPHSHLRDFLDRRVMDGVIRRMIDKWLKAGILEDGVLRHTTEGSPQGGVISPCLSNI